MQILGIRIANTANSHTNLRTIRMRKENIHGNIRIDSTVITNTVYIKGICQMQSGQSWFIECKRKIVVNLNKIESRSLKLKNFWSMVL